MACLGMSTTDAYLAWCRRHGFRADTFKGPVHRRRELAFMHDFTARQHLAASRRRRDPVAVIQSFCSGDLGIDAVRPESLRHACQELVATRAGRRHRRAVGQLVGVLGPKTDFFVHLENVRRQSQTYLGALALVAAYRRAWVRPVETWRPRRYNRARQFASLLGHLFAGQRVPLFLDSVWFRNDPPSVAYRKLFIRLAQGEDVRRLTGSAQLTRRMAAIFLKSPAACRVEAAIRRGQILALGGDERLWQAVCRTHLGLSLDNDEFWVSVLRFFIRFDVSDWRQVHLIVRYLDHQKFELELGVDAAGRIALLQPPRPNLSMAGRRPETLLAQARAWWRTERRRDVTARLRWDASGIRGATFREGEGRRRMSWTIRELCSAQELIGEARAMRHCVDTYAWNCADGGCSIWSMTSTDAAGTVRRRQTIEVSRDGAIIQSLGRRNTPPGAAEQRILARWARQESLTGPPDNEG